MMKAVDGGVGKLQQVRAILTFPSYFVLIDWRNNSEVVKSLIIYAVFLPLMPLLAGSFYFEMCQIEGRYLSKEEFHKVWEREIYEEGSDEQGFDGEYRYVFYLLILVVASGFIWKVILTTLFNFLI